MGGVTGHNVINIKNRRPEIISRTEVVESYYKDVRHLDNMSEEEESELINIVKTEEGPKRKRAIDKLILGHQKFIISAARAYANQSDLSDLISEANIGFSKAIENFDPSRGVKLISFASFYVKRAITQYRLYEEPQIRKTNVTKTAHLVSKATNDFIQLNQREPTEAELLYVLNTKYNANIRDPYDLIALDVKSVDSMSEDAADKDPQCMHDTEDFHKHSCSYNAYEVTIEADNIKTTVADILSGLKDRDRVIMEMAYGLNGHSPNLTNKEIGAKLGISAERVRQKRDDIMKKLKKKYHVAS